MIWRRIVVGLNLLVWGFWLWTGIGLLRGVANQHVPGYPNSGQIEYYAGIPGVLVVICLAFAALVFFNKGKLASSIANIIQVTALIAVLPYMIVYGGGV